MLISGMAVAAPSPAAAGVAFATCEYDSYFHQVKATLTGDQTTHMWRDTAGKIWLEGIWCGGAATAANTDHIVITGDGGNQIVNLLLLHGGFKPGFTDEPRRTDEIEFTIALGGGTSDALQITGTNAIQKIDIGQMDFPPSGTAALINLNAAETKSVDTDVLLYETELISIDLKGGNDVVRAQGNASKGINPLGVPLYVYGGNGNDTIKGGSNDDHLYGGLGVDKIWGYGGDDYIDLFDGVAGDIGNGGDGTDSCTHDLTDTCGV
jgi:hypothetical protein